MRPRATGICALFKLREWRLRAGKDPFAATFGNDCSLRIPAISLHRRVTKFAMFVTTEVVFFRATDQPTDLAPRCARSPMLSSMLALDRQAREAALSHPSS